ncbi:MAG: family 1 glycosylhydrolase [Candidatus Omnitrophica bacterium]|nr:family 1 glycosylhydrolase [Candidatus Omnitrophota bacterium]
MFGLERGRVLSEIPRGFLWGAAISSYQCEGGNTASDWCVWERQKKLTAAGDASRHYTLFDDDFSLARETGLNSLRFSLEWARLQPAAGGWNEQEFAHYETVLSSLAAHQLVPFITLHHFTLPLWYAARGGFENPRNIDLFLRYLREAAVRFRDRAVYWIIFNEPLVYIVNGYLRGIWPPGKKSLSSALRTLKNILSCYETAYQEMKQIYGSRECRISLSKHFRVFFPCNRYHIFDRLSSGVRAKSFNFWLDDLLARRRLLDFVGVNYYCGEFVRTKGLFGAECAHTGHALSRNAVGWYLYPEGLKKILMRLKRLSLPVIVTENGTAETDEARYAEYLRRHLEQVAAARAEGVDLRGYFWWSLIDNFEWDLGFGPRFGLYRVDYRTYERVMRPHAALYRDLIRGAGGGR